MKKKLIVLLGISLSAVVVTSTTITFSLFTSSVRLSQGAGSEGKLKESIYLCPNIWDVDEPSYLMYAWNSDSVPENGSASIYEYIRPSKTVSVRVSTTDMECQVFEFDTVKYDRFLFYRLDGKISGAGYQTTESDTFKLYKFKTPTNEAISLYRNVTDTNHYIARNVELAVGDKLKIKDLREDENNGWYTNAISSSPYHIDSSDNNNIVIDVAGTYTIDFYVEHKEGNHIGFTDESDPYNFIWNQTADITYSSSTKVYRINSWNAGNNKSGYETYADITT